jgi:hypothetical protein
MVSAFMTTQTSTSSAAAVGPAQLAQSIGAAKSSYQDAMIARQTTGIPALNADAKTRIASLKSGAVSAAVAPNPAVETLSVLQRNGDDRLRQLFHGKALENESKGLAAAIEMQKGSTNFRALDGGADSFSYKSERAIDADTVEITGSVRAWSKVAQVQSDGIPLVIATPSNVLNVTTTMKKNSQGLWQVDSFVWEFAPGSAP